MRRLALAAFLLGCSGVPVTVSEPAMDASDAARPQIVDSEPPAASEPGYVPVTHRIYGSGAGWYPSETLVHPGDTVRWEDLPGWHIGVASGFLGRADGLCGPGPLPLECVIRVVGPLPFYSLNDQSNVGIVISR